MAGETFPALPPRPFDANKSTMGSVTVVGASTGLSGAAILAAHAAIRSGCGRVTIAVPATVANVAEEQKPLEVMCWSPLDGESCWTATAIDSLLQSPTPIAGSSAAASDAIEGALQRSPAGSRPDRVRR